MSGVGTIKVEMKSSAIISIPIKHIMELTISMLRPTMSMRFMQKEAPLFKSAAQKLGYADVIIGGSVSDSLQKKQHQIMEDLEKQATKKLNRYGIPWVGVDSATRVDGKIAELLEKNKLVN